jgi:hypothetical protein
MSDQPPENLGTTAVLLVLAAVIVALAIVTGALVLGETAGAATRPPATTAAVSCSPALAPPLNRCPGYPPGF